MALQDVGGANIRTPLNNDFGHAPIGAFNGRRIEQVDAQEARVAGSLLSRIGASISNFASRIVNIVTPESVRTERAFREGLSATSQHTANLLGALSGNDPAPSANTIQNLMSQLPDIAAPVTRHGHTLPDVLEQRLNIHIANMTSDQRNSLLSGMESIQNPTAETQGFITSVRSVLNQQLVHAAAARLQEPLDQAVDRSTQIGRIETAMKLEATQPPEELSQAEQARIQDQVMAQQAKSYDLLAGTKHAAQQLLDEYGFNALPGREQAALSAALIKHLLDPMIEASHDDDFAASQLLTRLPTRDLQSLNDANPALLLGTNESGAADMTVPGTIAVRVEKLEETLRHQAERLPELRDALRNSDYINRLAQANQTLHAMNELHRIFDMSPSDGISEIAATVTATVNNQQQQLSDSAATALQPAMIAAQNGNLSGVLRGLDQAHAHIDTIAGQHISLGATIDGADAIMEFRESIVLGALAKLDNPALIAVANSLETPVARALHETLADAAMPLLTGEVQNGKHSEALGRMLFDRSIDIELLRSTTQQAVAARGLVQPPPSQAPDESDPNVFTIIRHGLDVQLNIRKDAQNVDTLRVDAQPMPPAAQERITEQLMALINDAKEHIRTRPDEKADLFNVQTPNGNVALAINNALTLDIPRATYTYQSLDTNEPVQLAHLKNDAGDGTQKTIESLFNNVAHRNPAMMRLISHLAQQDMAAPFQLAFVPNPELLEIHTPRDSVGSYVIDFNSGKTSYHLVPDTDGGVTIHIDVEEAPSMLIPIPDDGMPGGDNQQNTGSRPETEPESPYTLDPSRSYQRFSYSIHIDADLNAYPTGPALYGTDYEVLAQA